MLRTLLEGHTTAKEDLQQFAYMVVESDQNSDEMKENKPMVQLIDKFCLRDHELFFDI